MTDKRHLKVVLASPGDVQPERKRARRAVAEVGKYFDDLKSDIALDLKQWETDAYPGLHPKGIQGQIDEALGLDYCDILIGIFWKRFGTPVYDAGSGTEHEIRVAYQRWQKTGQPQVMLYFSKQPYCPVSVEEFDQWKKVFLLWEEFKSHDLGWPYRDPADFEASLRVHLFRAVCKMTGIGPDITHVSATSISSDVTGLLQLRAPQTEVRLEGLTEPIGELVLSFACATCQQTLDNPTLLQRFHHESSCDK